MLPYHLKRRDIGLGWTETSLHQSGVFIHLSRQASPSCLAHVVTFPTGKMRQIVSYGYLEELVSTAEEKKARANGFVREQTPIFFFNSLSHEMHQISPHVLFDLHF